MAIVLLSNRIREIKTTSAHILHLRINQLKDMFPNQTTVTLEEFGRFEEAFNDNAAIDRFEKRLSFLLQVFGEAFHVFLDKSTDVYGTMAEVMATEADKNGFAKIEDIIKILQLPNEQILSFLKGNVKAFYAEQKRIEKDKNQHGHSH